jgi:hypothetical protein
MGYCRGYAYPGYSRMRGAYGRGMGYRNMYWATGVPGWQRSEQYGRYPYIEPLGDPVTEEDEARFLQREAEDLEQALKNIRSRLQKLTGGQEGKK